MFFLNPNEKHLVPSSFYAVQSFWSLLKHLERDFNESRLFAIFLPMESTYIYLYNFMDVTECYRIHPNQWSPVGFSHRHPLAFQLPALDAEAGPPPWHPVAPCGVVFRQSYRAAGNMLVSLSPVDMRQSIVRIFNRFDIDIYIYIQENYLRIINILIQTIPTSTLGARGMSYPSVYISPIPKSWPLSLAMIQWAVYHTYRTSKARKPATPCESSASTCFYGSFKAVCYCVLKIRSYQSVATVANRATNGEAIVPQTQPRYKNLAGSGPEIIIRSSIFHKTRCSRSAQHFDMSLKLLNLSISFELDI